MSETLEAADAFAALRNGIRRIADERRDWAGIPMPLDGLDLVIEPRFPKAKELMDINRAIAREQASDVSCRNIFWSNRLRRNVYVVQRSDGKVEARIDITNNQCDLMIGTLQASAAWGVEQEAKAVDLLAGMIRHHMFKAYLLTGMFLETSPRSGLHYLFRRLRPTVVLSAKGESLRILTCLCMHPIGYYAHTWAGAMTPTDEIIAHLAMMRGDEHLFWKRANQHHPSHAEAGL